MTPRGAPSAWVARFAPSVPAGGAVLDVACGRGRHTAYFRARGHPVTAIDRDLGGLGDLRADPGVETWATDLEDGRPFPLRGRRFAGVVVAHYLHRPILPDLVAAVAPGGVLIYETASHANARHGRPRSPDHLLRPNELLADAGPHLDVVAFEDVVEPAFDGPAAWRAVQRLCARRPG